MSVAFEGKMQLSADQQGILGVTFCALPPGPLMLNSVLEGTWAEQQGLKAGDVILAVNGDSPTDMARSDFMDTMRQRPVVLTFDHPAVDAIVDEEPKPLEEVAKYPVLLAKLDQKDFPSVVSPRCEFYSICGQEGDAEDCTDLCPVCEGTGFLLADMCPLCDGNGGKLNFAGIPDTAIGA